MGAKEFGRYVDQARRAKGWSQGKLGLRIGELPETGRFFDATGIRRILEGGSVRLDRELVDRLIQVLGLDPFVAYELADLRPAGFSAEDHKRFQLVAASVPSDLPGRIIPPCRVLAGQGRRARPGRGVLVRHTRRVTASA